jgi:vacuolar-type H+-ATPase subunit H
MKYLILALSLLVNLSLYAQVNATHPCADDLNKFCSGVKKGEGRMAKCLKEHENELSNTCAEKIAGAKEKIKARAKLIVANCKDELKKFCKDSPKGHGSKLKCLESHKTESSELCKAVLL